MPDYMDLRIALAKGECVTDCSGTDVFRCADNMDILWWSPTGKEWKLSSGVRFGPNSKVVPDPSVEEDQDEPRFECCGTRKKGRTFCQHCIKSLSYQEALDSEAVRIAFPWGNQVVCQQYTNQERLLIDLAERHGYLMQRVED